MQFPTGRSRFLGRGLILALALILGPSSSAFAQVDEILIGGFHQDLGGGAMWRFRVSIDAADGDTIPTSGSVSPPSGPDIMMTGDGTRLEFTSAPFASFATLQGTYPAGDYDVALGGESVTLNWNPTAPSGSSGEPSLTITAPANGSVRQSATPNVSYTLDCTNCKDLSVELYDVATDGDMADFELFLADQLPGSLPNPVLFSSLTRLGPLAVLPNESNQADVICGLATFSDVGFDLPTTQPDFTYVEAAVLFETSIFDVGPANSMFVVNDVLIEAAYENSVWNFFIEVEGQDLPTTATVTPLGEAPIMLTTLNAGFELDFADTGFATFSELQIDHPAGIYYLDIGNERVTLFWDPTAPTGASGDPSLSILSPANGATGVSSQPETSFSFDCTNCNDLDLALGDTATGGMVASFGFSQLDVTPPGNFTNPISFSALTQNSGATELPSGESEIELIVGLADFATVGFDPPTLLPTFQYVAAGTVIEVNTFTVPEPALFAVHGIALATLAALARRRRRR